MNPEEFIVQIEFENILYPFLFRKIWCGSKVKYFVQLHRREGPKLFFEMKQNESGNWKVLRPVPDWVLEREHLLHLAILDQGQ